LPTLAAGSITIDASDAGVILDGNHTVLKGIEVASSYNRVMGLQIMNFNTGLLINGHYNQIGGDRLVGSGPSGQGNVLNGNDIGVLLQSASHNTVTGNMVGTDPRGVVSRGNRGGVVLMYEALHNRIGGRTPGERNIISGNTHYGVDLLFNSNSWNVIAGNYIGTDITGMMAIPNGFAGVALEMGATNNTVGGPTPAERNIISGNSQFGVLLSDFRTMHNTVIGNYIGTNATGTAALPNGDGILVWIPGFNRIGGTRPGEGNLISGNQSNGVSVGGVTTRDVVIIGNAIGTDVNGNQTLGNGKGINFYEGVKHNFLGGGSSAEGNTIRGNGIGVVISQAGTKYNSIAGNVISNSMSYGISVQDYATSNYIAKNTIADNNPGIMVSQGNFNTLRANAITGNHTAGIQLDAGGNQMLAAPAITFSNNTRSVWGAACAGCLVDIFSDMNDQGAIYEGSAMTDSAGAFTFSMSATMSGPKVTATVTDSQGNSSGFSSPQAGITVPPFISQSDCLFTWAERAYSTLFAPAGAASNLSAPYYYRYYSQTNAYLGTSFADNHVYYIGPVSNNALLDVGALSTWLATAGCQ
jgi:titin